MGTYLTSTGDRVTQSQIDYRIRKAKEAKRQMMLGYEFCEDCGRSDTVIDMSHDKGIQACKNDNQVELAWDVENLTLRCRECHRKHDGSELIFNH